MRFVIFLLAVSFSLAQASAPTDSDTELGKRELEPRFGLNEGFDVSLAQRQKHRPSRLHDYTHSMARKPLSQHAGSLIAPKCSPERPCVVNGGSLGNFAYVATVGKLIRNVAATRYPASRSASKNLDFFRPQKGPITSYGGNAKAQEACHYQDWLPLPGQFMAAIGDSNWDNSRGCGTCIHLQGDHHEGYVFVRNRCPECGTGLDLYQETFNVLMNGGSSEKTLQNWRFVNCNVLFTGGLVVRMHESATEWYAPFQIRNSFKPVVAAYFKRVGTKEWIPAVMDQSYNHFVPNLNNVKIDAMDILIKAFDGEVIVVKRLEVRANRQYQLVVNFSEDAPFDHTFSP